MFWPSLVEIGEDDLPDGEIENVGQALLNLLFHQSLQFPNIIQKLPAIPEFTQKYYFAGFCTTSPLASENLGEDLSYIYILM